ncbi:hypothetical protein [Protaetiibacter mangrovi]|uniref:Uncharacterized protein n=1 Tax=Protaetiibacter mangrovi TaxID=2970926 RepID=A0ABT1ZFX8_9MICO|nr:hypothetical protein [Protaetiibacter mangrovi]MCS0499613.1 hypothetical protein [Protaetiibacter mangrovi]TPX03585.1 hypothetical protein FJ656_16385 [Schumannella luteola]
MIRGVGFPPTAQALWNLGVSTGPLGPVDYTVEVDGPLLILAMWRRREVVLELPIVQVREVTVGEVASGALKRRIEPAILVRISAVSREVVLPIVPVTDTGRSLRWNDPEIWQLASRLAAEVGVPLTGRRGRGPDRSHPGHTHRWNRSRRAASLDA